MDSDPPITNPFAARLAQNSASLPSEQSPLPPPPPQQEALKNDSIQVVDGEMKLNSIEQVWRAAKLIRQSGLCPSSFKNDQQLVIAILRALELKVPVFQALEGMVVVNGRIGIMGDLALAIVQGSGLLEEKSVSYSGEGDELACTVNVKRKGRPAQAYVFSIKAAKTAGLIDRSAVWRAYPQRMLYYRALGFGLRDEFGDVLKGIKTTEELQDYPQS